MTLEPFAGRSRLPASALLAGHHLNLRSGESFTRLASAPLVLAAGRSGCAVLESHDTAGERLFGK